MSPKKWYGVLDGSGVIAYLLLGGLLLLVWPAAAIASVMGLAGHVPKGTSIITLLPAYIFFMGILCYPIVYIACVVMSIIKLITSRSKADFDELYRPSFLARMSASRWASIPMLYVAVLFLPFFIVLLFTLIMGG